MKKLTEAISLVLCFALLFSFSAFAAEKVTVYKGDVNENGKVESSDARLILRAATKLDDFTVRQIKIADFDGNDEVSSSDARMALRTSVRLEKLLTISFDAYNEYECIRTGTFYLKGSMQDEKGEVINCEIAVDKKAGTSYISLGQKMLFPDLDSKEEGKEKEVEIKFGVLDGKNPLGIKGQYFISPERKAYMAVDTKNDDFKDMIKMFDELKKLSSSFVPLEDAKLEERTVDGKKVQVYIFESTDMAKGNVEIVMDGNELLSMIFKTPHGTVEKSITVDFVKNETLSYMKKVPLGYRPFVTTEVFFMYLVFPELVGSDEK